jgi:hypothetical protein
VVHSVTPPRLALFGVGDSLFVLSAASFTLGMSATAMIHGTELALVDVAGDEVTAYFARGMVFGAVGGVLGPVLLILATAVGFGWRAAFLACAPLLAVYGWWLTRLPLPGRRGPNRVCSVRCGRSCATRACGTAECSRCCSDRYSSRSPHRLLGACAGRANGACHRDSDRVGGRLGAGGGLLEPKRDAAGRALPLAAGALADQYGIGAGFAFYAAVAAVLVLTVSVGERYFRSRRCAPGRSGPASGGAGYLRR